ncbi:RNA polymerase sigma factor [Spongiibacter marinus]|uniref:RNA polymerase sigma factor n=1 Tax=Spongiibacter marinus TaxID=354246 RepID=UPI0004147635|nr:RNA polymerase sigma factor [Spongiibacter marinus]
MNTSTPQTEHTSPIWQHDWALAERLKHGDRKAYASAYRDYHPAMVGIARQYVEHSLAEDAAQSAWVAALERMHQFEGRSTLKTWLCRITINMALTARRKRQKEITVSAARWSALADESRHAHPEEALSAPELALDSARTLHNVDEKMRRMNRAQANALYLRATSAIDGKQISESLALSHANMRVMLHRARNQLSACR